RVFVDVRVQHREPVEDVVALLGCHLRRRARRVVRLVHVVDRDLDVVRLAPLDDVLLVEPLVVGRHEVTPLDDLELRARLRLHGRGRRGSRASRRGGRLRRGSAGRGRRAGGRRGGPGRRRLGGRRGRGRRRGGRGGRRRRRGGRGRLRRL